MDEKSLIESLEELRHQLAFIELTSRPRRNGDYIEYLVLKHENLKFKIDPNLNHARPHFHVDYGHHFHALSVSIDTSEVLAGQILNRYLRVVKPWAETNRDVLLKIWNALRESKDPAAYLVELK